MILQIKLNIKRKIKEKGLTTGKVCETLHTDRGYIRRMTDEVKLNKIIAIAKAIGCTPAELLDGIE